MSRKITYDQYLSEKVAAGEISEAEQAIIAGFIARRKSTKSTSHATQKKHAYNAVAFCQILHERSVTLDKCSGENLFQVVEVISNTCTQNSRQTKITILKGLAKYIDQWHHPIVDMSKQLDDVSAGSAERNTKEILTIDEWENVLNAPMSVKGRAQIAMLYDGYHRPMEIFILKWSDLKITKKGIEYRIKFKTEKPRTILQKKETTAMLELWRQEVGGEYGKDPRYIFTDKAGNPYSTTRTLQDLFKDLKKKTGIGKLTASMIRNTAITHDVEAELPISYICLRAWGDTYNDLINIYADPNSSKLQADVQGRDDSTNISIRRRKIKSVIICPSCETINPPNAQFCNSCRTELSDEAKRLANSEKGFFATSTQISQEEFNRMLLEAKQKGVI